MKKKLTLLIFLFPMLLMAQTEFKNGGLSIDFSKKKKQSTEDSIKEEQIRNAPDEDEDAPKEKKARKETKVVNAESVTEDWKKDGLFKAIVHIGVNGSQIDGDGYAGYNKIGFDGGVGVQVRFHKFLSATMELNYTQRGARQKFIQNGSGYVDSTGVNSLQLYRVIWDYIDIPISLNVQDKKYIMFSLGLSPAVLVRYKERDEQGQDDTYPAPPGGQPSKFDLSAFGALNFLIQQHYAFGLKFSYSLLKVRGNQYPGLSRVNGEYSNVLTLRFSVIIDKTLFKKKS